MKKYLICTTFHKPGEHHLIIGGSTVLKAATEIELVREAKRKGINFRDLDHKPGVGDKSCFYTQWFGDKGQVDYLNWKGTLGAGARLKQIIKEHNDNG